MRTAKRNNPLDVAIEFVDHLTPERIRVYAQVAPKLPSIKNYQARTHLEELVHALCMDRVGRSVSP
jgi:hypothetical protein